MKTSTILLLLLTAASTTTAFFHVPTSEDLRNDYPDLESDRPGNPLILCPFCRMIERSGRMDNYKLNEEDIVPGKEFAKASSDFGCSSITACGPIVATVSAGQHGGFLYVLNPFTSNVVDLERFWDAPPITHQCGLTFEKDQGQNGVSTFRLNRTMGKLANRTDADGHLTYQDIMDVKLETCEEQGVGAAALLEAELIFAYLGGKERGYVEYSDIERFLAVDSKMPLTKAEGEITFFYMQNLGQA